MNRKATAGIVAAVLFFAMFFTVGTSYLIFVNNENLLYTKSLVSRANYLQSVQYENLVVSTLLISNHVGFYVNNTGGVNTNITSVFILDSSGNILSCDGTGLPTGTCSNSTPPLPITVNVGRGSAVIDTGYTYSSGTVTVQLWTQRGASFTQTYPLTQINNPVANALSAGAIGDLYLEFSSYRYYSVAACGPNYCLTAQGDAFGLSHTTTDTFIAFSVRMTNLNANQKNITLDAYSLLMQFMPPPPGLGGGNARQYAWYVVSNTSNTINPTYSPITLFYNQPKTIVFASSGPSTFAGYAPGISASTVVLVFVLSHGCQGIRLSNCNSNTYNYGQNVPYVSTLYS